MMSQLASVWDRIRSSFWFLPSILIVLAIVAGLGVVAIDEVVSMKNPWLRGWIYTGSAEGARTILGTIAGSMITIAGVVSSLTLVALTLASSQLGPRLLRNFRRDTTNQIVMGAFLATFLYCLLVLRTIRGEDAGAFVPAISISFGVLLALVSLGILIYFIHHVAVSIQSDEMVARVTDELYDTIDRLFPATVGEDKSPAAAAREMKLPEDFDREARRVASRDDGYVQMIEPDALMKLAVRKDAVIRIERRPGHYVAMGYPLVRVWPPERVDDEFISEVNDAFIIGSHRTPLQDVEFCINQLVEVALRALSPGINDPFTAVTCVDRMGSGLARLAGRQMPSPFRADEEGRLRVVARPVRFSAIVDAAFDQVRQCSRCNAAVSIRLLETIAEVADVVTRSEDREALHRQAEMIARGAREGVEEELDRKETEERFGRVREKLAQAEAETERGGNC